MDQFVDCSDLNKTLATAPGNPAIWERFLSRVTAVTACESSYILIADLIQKENTRFLFSFNLSEKQQSICASEDNLLDPFNTLLAKNPFQVFCNKATNNQHCTDTDYNSNWPYCFGFSIPCNTHHSLNLCVNRSYPFSDQEKQDIEVLLLSMIAPLKVAVKAELQQKINSQILHYMPDHFDGYVIVNRSFNLLFSDAVYSLIIDGFNSVSISGQYIEFSNPTVKQQISSLMEDNDIASIINQCDGYRITIIPVSCLDNLYDWECIKDGYILALTHYKETNVVLDRLINVHKLSKCEASYALDFIQTPSIAEIAENNYRSQDTIRNHIKHIMQKMEVHNQAALMKKLITLSAL